MGKTVLSNALLFNKEIGARPYRYRLYFAVQSEDEQPVIHRLYVRSAKLFHEMALGGNYDLTCSGIRITDTHLNSTETLSDVLYYRLIDLKDLQFMDDRDAKRFGIFEDDYDPSELYYSFKTYRSLVEYTPSYSLRLAIWLIKMLGYILSMFIPVGLYILGIYSISLLAKTTDVSLFHALAIPIAATLSLPIVLWMINALHTFFDTSLLSIPSFRNHMLKLYALRWGGFKKNTTLSNEQRHYYAKFGMVSLGLFLIGVILLLLAL